MGVPRMCSAKLERCDDVGFGELILSAGGGGERPMDETELASDCNGEGVVDASFFPLADPAWSAMVQGSKRGLGDAGRGVCQRRPLDILMAPACYVSSE